MASSTCSCTDGHAQTASGKTEPGFQVSGAPRPSVISIPSSAQTAAPGRHVLYASVVEHLRPEPARRQLETGRGGPIPGIAGPPTWTPRPGFGRSHP